jgi:hypothetical protein
VEIYLAPPVSIRRRRPDWVVTKHDWRYQAERLENEGQIEPIEVVIETTTETKQATVRTFRVAPAAWVYAEAQIVAAMELGWPTLLVTY